MCNYLYKRQYRILQRIHRLLERILLNKQSSPDDPHKLVLKSKNNKKPASLPSYTYALILRTNQRKIKERVTTRSNIRILFLLTVYYPILYYRYSLTYAVCQFTTFYLFKDTKTIHSQQKLYFELWILIFPQASEMQCSTFS